MIVLSTIADILNLSDGDPSKVRAIRDAVERLAGDLSEITSRQVLVVGDCMTVDETCDENKLYQQRRPPEWLREWSGKGKQDGAKGQRGANTGRKS